MQIRLNDFYHYLTKKTNLPSNDEHGVAKQE